MTVTPPAADDAPPAGAAPADAAPADAAPADAAPSDAAPSDAAPSDAAPADAVLAGAGPADVDPAEPRWLSGPEAAAWTNLAQLIMLLPAALDRQLREDAGIPHAYYGILAALSAQPHRAIRMTELARRAGTTTSRLSHAVATLEQRGWVERHPCPSDKRGQIARLTDAGLALLEGAAPGHVAEVRSLVFDHLTDEDVTHLRAITAKLLPTLTGDMSTPPTAGG